MSFMSNEKTGGPGVDNGEMMVVTSTGDGVTWSGAKGLSGVGAHWPGLHVLNDNSFLALYGSNGKGMVSHKFGF